MLRTDLDDSGAPLKQALKILLYVCLSVVGIFLLLDIGSQWWLERQYRLPSEQHVRAQFQVHKPDFVRFAALLQMDPRIRFVKEDGRVSDNGKHERLVPEYRDLMRRIGAQFVQISDDGSMEFALYGFGCAICSDSYLGVRYLPKNHEMHSGEWLPMVVASLSSAKLPQEDGLPASGLYVVPIEPDWFVYRFEYQE